MENSNINTGLLWRGGTIGASPQYEILNTTDTAVDYVYNNMGGGGGRGGQKLARVAIWHAYSRN